MTSSVTSLTVHRATQEIGGNCIEITHGDHRLILDVGSPLDPPPDATPASLVPFTLDTTRPVDAIIVSHPHQDHYGLLTALPSDWPVWSGAPTDALMRITSALTGRHIEQQVHHYKSFEPFTIGPFTVTPYLTDHSAFDAHMLLVEVAGKRVFYSGDFRRTGRKSVLVDRFLESPPQDVDILLMEGTALGRTGGFPTESELEDRFVEYIDHTSGRVFVTWSAQNIDRTVTIYRACKRTGRTLVLDPYAVDVLERLAPYSKGLPQLGWKGLRAVVAGSISRMYQNPKRMNDPDFIDRISRSGKAFGAAKLETKSQKNVIMLRPSLLRDYIRQGVELTGEDAWVFSMWSGYLARPEFEPVRTAFADVGVKPDLIHTSGHAAKSDLIEFAKAVAPLTMVPIHGESWDEHTADFSPVTRLGDGEPLVLS